MMRVGTSLSCGRFLTGSAGWKLEPKDRAARLVRGDPDSSAHLPDELSADVEAEAGASDPAPHFGVEPRELVEDLFSRLWRNADPFICHSEPEATRVYARGELDRPPVGRVLDGVLEQVEQHAPQ